MDFLDCKPSTSGKCFGDSHIEISDEDGDTSECVEKTEGDSIGKFDDPCRDESNETVLNDRYLLDGHNPRNFYIVKSDGRPAEMFRTDLFEKVRKGIDADLDSDDDYVPGSGLARITDRWRPEWSSGTQVPMQPNISKCSEVRQATVGQDSPCSTSVQFKRRQLMKKFLIEPFKKPISSPLRLYECTILDVQWLQLLNERLCNSAMSELPMEVFLEIMNDFEIECYKNIHRKLLEPLHSPSYQGVEQDEEAACDICRIVSVLTS
ncbi:hypothetical protein DICVIV_00736 [Dictyocaulus viviparus]|uniref:Uncharacterized protein n=1 Tax=Dictyocaulus viviparus TaxID=29172 RepID=A0A0D8YEI9_DICVI|nr:hypothetical protein DICVIV_00736 [Dictyocaulus viviparus]